MRKDLKRLASSQDTPYQLGNGIIFPHTAAVNAKPGLVSSRSLTNLGKIEWIALFQSCSSTKVRRANFITLKINIFNLQ